MTKIKQIILIAFILTSCIRNNESIQNKFIDSSISNCDTFLSNKKTFKAKVPIYTIDPIFNKYLDTIVSEEKSCTFYDSCHSGFLFYIRDFDFLPDSNIQFTLDDLIDISVADIYAYDYSKCYGVFVYGGFRFICDSLCKKELLNKTGKTVLVKYIIPEKREPFINDCCSYWTFLYQKKNLKLYSHFPCYKGEEKYPTVK